MINQFLSHAGLVLLMAMLLTTNPSFSATNHDSKEANFSAFLNSNDHHQSHRHRYRRHCCKRHQCKRHRPKPCCKKGPTGPTGATGATGSTGATGAIEPGPLLDYASFFNISPQGVNPGTLISFDSTSVNQRAGVNGITTTPGVTINSPFNTTFTIQVAGDYLINLGIFAGETSQSTPVVQIFLNNNPINGGSQLSGEIIGTSLMLADLHVGDTIKILAFSIFALIDNGSQNAYLTFLRVGP